MKIQTQNKPAVNPEIEVDGIYFDLKNDHFRLFQIVQVSLTYKEKSFDVEAKIIEIHHRATLLANSSIYGSHNPRIKLTLQVEQSWKKSSSLKEELVGQIFEISNMNNMNESPSRIEVW